ncbi:hypothetical protein N2152v2_001828 [Parachlorella kessleri]
MFLRNFLLLALGLSACARELLQTDSNTQDTYTEGYVELEFPALQAIGTSTTNVGFRPANFTAAYVTVSKPSVLNPDLPILFFLPNWNVEPELYTRFLQSLADKGYAVVAALTTETFPFPIEGMPYPGCPAEQLVPSAAALSSFSSNFDQFAEYLGRQDNATAPPSVVLLGAGPGAWSAMLAATGACDNIRLLRDPEAIVYCNGWRGFAGSIKGVIMDEISVNQLGTGFNLTNGQFALWLAGEWDHRNATIITYQSSSGGACSTYVGFWGVNDYAWVDYIGNATTGQRPACAYKSPDAPVFQPTEEQQNHNIDLSVSLVDAYIRAALLKDTAAAEYVAGIGDDPQVREAVDTDCFV